MEHRHLTTSHWPAAVVDSALERGDLKDWGELFAAVRANTEVAEMVLRVARQRGLGGSSILAAALTERLHPGLSKLRLPPLARPEGA